MDIGRNDSDFAFRNHLLQSLLKQQIFVLKKIFDWFLRLGPRFFHRHRVSKVQRRNKLEWPPSSCAPLYANSGHSTRHKAAFAAAIYVQEGTPVGNITIIL